MRVIPRSIKHSDITGCNTEDVMGIPENSKEPITIKYTYSVIFSVRNELFVEVLEKGCQLELGSKGEIFLGDEGFK